MVRFDGVSKRFQKAGPAVLERVSFHVPENGMLFITGESGSGKTTLLRLLMKDIEAEEGRIYVNGQDLCAVKRRGLPGYRKKIGYVFQDFRLLYDRSVYDNVALARRVAGAKENDIRSQVTAALKLVGMDALYKRTPEQLSGGQRAKVGVARAIVGNPLLLLADEPTGNLDPGSSRELMRLFMRIREMGTAVLIATHDMEMIRELEFPRLVLKEGGGAIFKGVDYEKDTDLTRRYGKSG